MDEDVYFVETRNADNPRIIRPTTVVRERPPRVVAGPAASATPVMYSPPPAQTVIYPAQPGPQYAPTWSAPSPMYAPGPIYAQPPWWNQLGGLFGAFGIGDLIKLGADAFAAFKSLPAAPVPTSDVATDVANSVVYMSALAKDATDRKKFEFAGELACGLTGRHGYGGFGAR
jgi:hypothetical protein